MFFFNGKSFESKSQRSKRSFSERVSDFGEHLFLKDRLVHRPRENLRILFALPEAFFISKTCLIYLRSLVLHLYVSLRPTEDVRVTHNLILEACSKELRPKLVLC